VRYTVKLAYTDRVGLAGSGGLELVEEGLEPLRIRDAKEHILFRVSSEWRNSVLQGRRTTSFIRTEEAHGSQVVKLSQDQGGGRPREIPAATVPRTVLSTVNAAESPTALLARREMQSWRLWQLEPASLRTPDRLVESPGIQPNGGHLPATLYALARHYSTRERDPMSPTWAYEQVATRLAELIDDVYALDVDRDERREQLTLQVRDRLGTVHPARALSDGTLRFLALAVLELDHQTQGVLCLEEPENGIHPERIPAMLRLLSDIAVDTTEPVGTDNPLRQVIVNTHSPVVVQQVDDQALLVAELREVVRDDLHFRAAVFRPLPKTWRTQGAEPAEAVSRGKLMAYLNLSGPPTDEDEATNRPSEAVRVIDREDLKQLHLPFEEGRR
jgi:predicted ATPase